MHSRSQFLLGTSAAIVAAGLPSFVSAQSGFTVEGSFDLGDRGWIRSISFAPERGIDPVRCIAALLPRSTFAATLVQTHRRSTTYNAVSDLGRSTNATIAINGGFFKYDTFAPDGLLVIDGTRVGELRTDEGGLALIDAGGNLTLTENVMPATIPRFAVQGLPMLVSPGGKMAMHSEAGFGASRSFVAVSGDTVIVGITSFVTLWHLADVMIEYPDAFGVKTIDAAINLTGDATSAFYAQLPDGTTLERKASWPNLDVLLFTRRRLAAT